MPLDSDSLLQMHRFVRTAANIHSDVFIVNAARCAMKRSSQQPALDVPATTVPPTGGSQERPAPSTRSRKSAAKATTAQAAAPFEEEFADAFEETDEAAAINDEWEDDMADEADLWGDDFDEAWEDDADIDGAIAYGDYFEDEFELDDDDDDDEGDDDDLTFFEEDTSVAASLRRSLERGMLRALAAPAAADFFERTLQALHQTSQKLAAAPTPRSRRRVSAQRNGHRGNSPQQSRPQSPHNSLLQLMRLIQRYHKRGLSEFDVLDDAIALFAAADDRTLMPVWAGLAARIATQSGEASGKSWSAEGRSALFNAAQKATAGLRQADALAVLPGLAATVGERFSQTAAAPSALPQLLYKTARQAAASPRLQQKLAAFEPTSSHSLLINANEMPLKVRVNAPLEIVFRQPRGQ